MAYFTDYRDGQVDLGSPAQWMARAVHNVIATLLALWFLWVPIAVPLLFKAAQQRFF